MLATVVELDGDEIFVTRPGTDMMTGYRKSPPARLSFSP
jgi:hypothetical protein